MGNSKLHRNASFLNHRYGKSMKCNVYADVNRSRCKQGKHTPLCKVSELLVQREEKYAMDCDRIMDSVYNAENAVLIRCAGRAITLDALGKIHLLDLAASLSNSCWKEFSMGPTEVKFGEALGVSLIFLLWLTCS